MTENNYNHNRDVCIIALSLDEKMSIARNRDIEHERRVSISDLLAHNYFKPLDCVTGPYTVVLSLIDKGLRLKLSDEHGQFLRNIELSLSPFRRVVKDYFIVCENYYQALRFESPNKIETMDRARRSLHNEGAVILLEKLSNQVIIDDDTARSLFTLICVLQMRG